MKPAGGVGRDTVAGGFPGRIRRDALRGNLRAASGEPSHLNDRQAASAQTPRQGDSRAAASGEAPPRGTPPGRDKTPRLDEDR